MPEFRELLLAQYAETRAGQSLYFTAKLALGLEEDFCSTGLAHSIQHMQEAKKDLPMKGRECKQKCFLFQNKGVGTITLPLYITRLFCWHAQATANPSDCQDHCGRPSHRQAPGRRGQLWAELTDWCPLEPWIYKVWQALSECHLNSVHSSWAN